MLSSSKLENGMLAPPFPFQKIHFKGSTPKFCRFNFLPFLKSMYPRLHEKFLDQQMIRAHEQDNCNLYVPVHLGDP